jgi:hypothetical protein
VTRRLNAACPAWRATLASAPPQRTLSADEGERASMTGAVLRLLLTMLLAYCAYAAYFFVQQRSMMYPIASRALRPMRMALPANAQAAELATSFGPVRVVFLRSSQAAARAPAVLFTHGNAELVEELPLAFAPINSIGVHVLLLEYPGYGGAPGEPSLASLNEASTAAFDWLAQRPDVDPARIVAMGVSLGGGPACELSVHRPLRALVLLSTFSAVDDFVRALWLPPILARDRYDNRARVAAFGGPVLVAHGRGDAVIPFAQGRSLADATRQAQFLPLDCGHNDCPYRSPGFAQTLRVFFVAHRILSEN